MEERTILELLIILKDEFEDDFYPGLCLTISLMEGDSITETERLKIYRYLVKHKPRKAKLGYYWWTSYEKEPRINFLNRLIKHEQLRTDRNASQG
jgi:hypothetical protein